MRLLVVEDDVETAGYVLRGLREHGHVADHAKDGHDGLMLAGEGKYDVLIIDRMLPKLDGLTLLKTLREGGLKTPALFLTAMGSVEDRVRGLETGDDYLVKPFAFAELYARVRSLSRRPPLEAPETALRSPISRWTCSAAVSPALVGRLFSCPPSSGCSSTCCGMRVVSSLAPCCSSPFGDFTLSPKPISWKPMSVACARRWTADSGRK